nr:uncharacterized protein LOC125180464 isoform X2 [Anser cygnoides]
MLPPVWVRPIKVLGRSVPAGGCCQPAAREAVNGLVPALPGTCSWTAGRWLFLKGIRPLVTQLPWNRRKGELEGTLKADMKNRLFAPSAVALSVFEDFHYVFPRSPRGQTEGSRYRQPVLRDGLSSGSGDGRSGTGRACRHGWGLPHVSAWSSTACGCPPGNPELRAAAS